MSVRILNGALDKEKGQVVLRGRIDPESLDSLRVDTYQREIAPMSTLEGIIKGYEKDDGSVPDIDLGMRGPPMTHGNDGVFILKEVTYIVDGLQRVSAAREYRNRGKIPRLGATIHFNTTKEWETERFRILNGDRRKVSPNVHLRNLQEKVPAVKLVYNLTMDDEQFVAKGRVCWDQRQKRNELVSAITLGKVVCQLHSHLSPGMQNVSKPDDLGTALQKLFTLLGPNALKENIRHFFQLINDCWGVRSVTYSETAVHLRLTFLRTLAMVLDNHEEFWREHALFVETDLVRKFKTFPIRDPEVRRLAGASGQAFRSLYFIIRDHLNKGKRTRRLKERRVVEAVYGDEPENEEGSTDQPLPEAS